MLIQKWKLLQISNTDPRVTQHVFYNQLTEQDRHEGILEGYLDINRLPALNLDHDGHYFICSPSKFIQKQYQDLVAAGVNKQRIYFEESGPQTLALN